MSKSLAASKKLMQNYLSELLTEEEPVLEKAVNVEKSLKVKEKHVQPLEKLLNTATLSDIGIAPEDEKLSTTKAKHKSIVSEQVNHKAEHVKFTETERVDTGTVAVEKNELKTRKSEGGFQVAKKAPSYRKGDFQAMFFEVAGLILAVPLVELGGIHNNDKTTALMGKPDWFKGVMLHRDEKISVVDTARWVMPEKCDEALVSALNYQYIIMLSNSTWGLQAEKLVDTVTLKQEDIKWLEPSNKRPWLAGLVKERMCALLDVESLITLLNKG